jgi:hypothetical protein
MLAELLDAVVGVDTHQVEIGRGGIDHADIASPERSGETRAGWIR